MRNEYFNNNKPIFDLHLFLCGNEKFAPDFAVPLHKRSYYLIHYVESGRLIFKEGNVEHEVSAGDIFIIYPDKLVSYRVENFSESVSCCWIGFTGSNAATYLDCAGVSHDNPVIHLNNNDFSSSINHMVNGFESGRELSEITLNRHLLRCMRSIEKSLKKQTKRYNNSIDYTEDAINFIVKNYMTGISTNDVVAYLRLNRSYVYKIFKQQTGKSISRYLIDFRIERSKEFISGFDFTFSQIAGFVGINDTYYFSKLFKSVTGISPSEYKKECHR